MLAHRLHQFNLTYQLTSCPVSILQLLGLKYHPYKKCLHFITKNTSIINHHQSTRVIIFRLQNTTPAIEWLATEETERIQDGLSELGNNWDQRSLHGFFTLAGVLRNNLAWRSSQERSAQSESLSSTWGQWCSCFLHPWTGECLVSWPLGASSSWKIIELW